MEDNIADVTQCKWKYLRETTTKYFDPQRNTSLSEYLEYMFKGHTFVYDKRIPKDVVKCRNANVSVRSFRPDARCEELNLIIEFDGTAHYQDPSIVLQDREKDKYLNSLGYHVVRIPYWIQLSRPVIDHLFACVSEHLTLTKDDKMCELPYSFFNPDNNDPCINISIGAMCELGRDRFLCEVTTMPFEIQEQIYYDVYLCCWWASEFNIMCTPQHIAPAYVMSNWMAHMCDLPDTYEHREQMLFNRPFAFTNYADHNICMFSLGYTRFCELEHLYKCHGFNHLHISMYPDHSCDDVARCEEFVIDLDHLLLELSIDDYLFLLDGVAICPDGDVLKNHMSGLQVFDSNAFKRVEDFCSKYVDIVEVIGSTDDYLVISW